MENKEINPIDGLFRNGMDGQESVPPSASWAQMEALLDAQGPQTKKKKVAIWYWAAAALLPFLMFSLWFFGFNPKQNEMAKSDSDSKAQKRSSGITKTEKRNEEMANIPSLEKEQIKGHRPKNGAEVKAADFKNIASNQSNSTENLNFTKLNPSQEAPKTENKLPIEMANSTPNVELPQTEKSKENDFEIASIEFKPEKKTSFVPDEQVASIEWKKESKTSLSEKIANIKSGQIKNFPTIAEAKESLVAWLSPQR